MSKFRCPAYTIDLKDNPKPYHTIPFLYLQLTNKLSKLKLMNGTEKLIYDFGK